MLFSQTHSTQEEIIKPIKILQNFYMKHQHLIPITLKQISSQLLNYIQVNVQKTNTDKELQSSIKKASSRFMSSIASHYHLMISTSSP